MAKISRSVEAEIAKFNRDYAEYAKGELTPYQTWREMKRDGWFNVDIAGYFNVSQNTASQWNSRFTPKLDSLSQ